MPERFQFLPTTVIWCENILRSHAHAFPTVNFGTLPQSTPRYNVMSDSLEWEDEVPIGLLQNGDLKMLYSALLNARTSVILDADSNGLCMELLLRSATLIPTWPGLLPERQIDSYRDVFVKLQGESFAIAQRILDNR